jgi:GTP-binding protein
VHGLGAFRHRRQFFAERGGNGAARKKHGKNGADLELRVPPGTIVRAEGEVIGDLNHQGQRLIVAAGGKGGRGNPHFVSPTRQAPYISETGQRGQDRHLQLDLKLLSDVGLIGLPNAGKSTLLRTVSRATPKVGNYPFTTLEPHLGVVEVGTDSYVMADIPGLIEGAHAGAGLGLDFLRHIERTRLLVHVVDASREDPAGDIAVVDAELRAYGHDLVERPQLLAFNKMDMPQAESRRADLTRVAALLARPHAFISAVGRVGTAELARQAFQMLERIRELEPERGEEPVAEPQVLRPRPRSPRFSVEREDGAFRVVGEQPVMLVEMLALQSDESRTETFRRLRRMGVTAALHRAGAREGDAVRFGDIELRWED